jgi:hypothetical protein
MQVTCAAAFHPKVWTYATAPRKTVFSEFVSLAGLPVPAPPFAQRSSTIADGNPRAKFLMFRTNALRSIAPKRPLQGR